MRSQMYEAAGSLATFSLMSKKPKEEVELFKDKIVRLFSLLHGMALSSIADQQEHFQCIDIESIPDRYISYLKGKSRRQKVEVVYQWINHLIIESLDNGLLNVPPPLLSRVFQELEKAMVEYNQVLQIMTISFPFPYAQVAVVMIWLYFLVTPFVATSWTAQPFMAAGYTLISAACFVGLEMIAAELENPFGDDINDLPCKQFQDESNDGLLLLVDPIACIPFKLGPNITCREKLCDKSSWHSFDEEVSIHNIKTSIIVDKIDMAQLELDEESEGEGPQQTSAAASTAPPSARQAPAASSKPEATVDSSQVPDSARALGLAAPHSTASPLPMMPGTSVDFTAALFQLLRIHEEATSRSLKPREDSQAVDIDFPDLRLEEVAITKSIKCALDAAFAKPLGEFEKKLLPLIRQIIQVSMGTVDSLGSIQTTLDRGAAQPQNGLPAS